MPSGPGRQRFTASTAVIILLTVVGLGTRWLKQYVPTESENLFDGSPEDYLTAARGHEIQWFDLEPEAFVEARRKDRLVMLVIGDVSCRMARYADRFGFLDRDATDKIRNSVIAIKVDGSKYPALLSSFMPFSRVQTVFEPLFQVWFLDPQGELISRGILGSAANLIDRRWILDRIVEAQAAWELKRKGEGAPDRQAADIALMDLPIETPDLTRHIADLRSIIQPGLGLVYMDRIEVWPQALRLMQTRGAEQDFRMMLDPILKSTVVDWQDGGFFRQVVDKKFEAVETDKLAVTNAEMSVVCAAEWRRTGSTFARRIARDTFDSLLDNFSDGEQIRGYRVGDGNLVRRSTHSSFSPRLLRDAFGPAEREWYRTNLGLRVEANPQMLPRVQNPKLVDDPLFDKMLVKLRNVKAADKPAYGGKNQLDFAASTLARLMEASRYLNDVARQQRLTEYIERLNVFRSGLDDVRKRASSDSTPTTFRDYLAYADVCLQDYEVYGRLDRLEEGAAVLRRGLTVFRGPRSGEYVEGHWPLDALNPPNSASPTMTDSLGESSTAMAIRLCYAFGALETALNLNHAASNPDFKNLGQVAQAIVARFGAVANRMQFEVSGYFLACGLVEDGSQWFAVGPDCDQMAIEARVRYGRKLTLPIWNPGPKQPRQRGYYRLEQHRWIGPLTLPQLGVPSAPQQ